MLPRHHISWRGRPNCLLSQRSFDKRGHIMASGQFNTQRAVSAFLLVVVLESTANIMCLHAYDGVYLRIEIWTSAVNLYTDKIFVQFFAIAEEGLLCHKLQESTLFRGICKVSALQDTVQLPPLLEQGDASLYEIVSAAHSSLPTPAAGCLPMGQDACA